jgi:hypothetical protein
MPVVGVMSWARVSVVRDQLRSKRKSRRESGQGFTERRAALKQRRCGY